MRSCAISGDITSSAESIYAIASRLHLPLHWQLVAVSFGDKLPVAAAGGTNTFLPCGDLSLK